MRVGAALTTPGRVGTARRPGSGKRDGKVYVRNRWCKAPQLVTSSNLVDAGWERCAPTLLGVGNFRAGEGVLVREAGVKVCGVAAARPQGQSRAPSLLIDWLVNVGTVHGRPDRPRPAAGGAGASSADGCGRGGVRVVVRGRESRLHGEGEQRDRSCGAVMPGGRR